MAEAAAVSLKKGMDSECADFFTKATDNSDYVAYIDAVKQGLAAAKRISIRRSNACSPRAFGWGCSILRRW